MLQRCVALKIVVGNRPGVKPPNYIIIIFFIQDISMIIRQKVLHSLVESFGKTTEFLSPILLSTVLTIGLPQIISYLPKYLTH